MNIKQHMPLLPFVGAIIIAILALQYLNNPKTTTIYSAFSTEKAQRRTIIASIKAKGILIPQEIIKIGNLINGIVRALYVKENDLIVEGQLLAEIDDSKEDADLNENFGALDTAQAVLSYQLEFLKRQQELYKYKQVSLDLLQQAERDYESAYAKVEQAKGLYEQAKLTYNNKRISSPVSGMIIGKYVSVGQTVSNFPPATILYSIAKDIKQLNAHIILEYDALDVIKPNTSATMILDTYPHKMFSGIITEITRIPHEMELSDYPYARLMPKTEKENCNCAIVPINNSDIQLRPGMTFNAHIVAAEKENVLSLPSKVFKITETRIQQLAAQLNYEYQSLDVKTRLEIASTDDAKTVWIYRNKTFIEKAVTIGINDGEYSEIIGGLDGSEETVKTVD